MAIEELDDIAEDLADKLGIYSEERQHWTYEFKQRVRQAVEIEQKLRAGEPSSKQGSREVVIDSRRDAGGER